MTAATPEIVAFLSYRYPEPLGCREKVVCADCKDHSAHAPVAMAAENFMPYRQTCHHCKKVICEGRTPAWCEFYPAPVALQ